MFNKNIFLVFLLLVTLLLVYPSLKVKADTGIDINFGDAQNFNNASTSDIVLSGMGESKFMTAYRDGGGSLNYGKVIVGQVVDDKIIYGEEFDFNPTNTADISITSVSEDKFIVAYQDEGNNKYGGLIVGELVGNEIIFGDEYSFNENTSNYVSINSISDSKFIIVYDNEVSSSHRLTMIIGEVDGTEVSFGKKNIVNYSEIDGVKVDMVSEDRFIITYKNKGSNKGVCVLGTITGDNVDFSDEFIFNPSEIGDFSTYIIDDKNFAVAYDDEQNSSQGRIVLGAISDSDITFGSEYIFADDIIGSVSLSLFDNDKILIAYQNKDKSDYGQAVVGQIENDVFVFDSVEYIFHSSDTEDVSINNLSKDKFILTYRNSVNDINYGTAIVGTIVGIEEDIEDVDEEVDDIEPIVDDILEETDDIITTYTIVDGDLIRNPNAEGMASFDIYIAKTVGEKNFKRLILSPHVFESYGHLSWDAVNDVDQATMDMYTTSELVRADGDEKVYKLVADGDTGTKEWLNMTAAEFEAAGNDWDSIYTINATDRDAYNK